MFVWFFYTNNQKFTFRKDSHTFKTHIQILYFQIQNLKGTEIAYMEQMSKKKKKKRIIEFCIKLSGCFPAAGSAALPGDPVWSHTQLLLSRNWEHSDITGGAKPLPVLAAFQGVLSGCSHREGERYQHIGRAQQRVPLREPVGTIMSISDGANADRQGPGQQRGWGKAPRWDPLTGGDGSRLGGPAWKINQLRGYLNRPKCKPPSQRSCVESAPKSTQPKANIWLHPAGLQGRGGRAR